MSTKLEFYRKFKERVFAEAPNIKTIRLFNNQFDNEDKEDAFEYPALFLEFLNLPWVTLPNGQQQSDAVIRLHIGFHSLRTEDDAIFENVELVHTAIQGYSVKDLFGNILRMNEEQDTDHGNVIVWLADYGVQLVDTSQMIKGKVLTTITTLDLDGDPDTPRLKQIQ